MASDQSQQLTTTTTTKSTIYVTTIANINVSNGNSSTLVSTDYFYQVEQLTFLWVLFTLIVIGNATVLIALVLSKGRKSRMNFFIKNLAVADLCVGLISVLTDIIWKITISWEAGLVACKIIRFSQATVTYASTYVLVALSIDRYDAITHPMNFSGSWRRARFLVIIAWLLSIIFSLPILIFYTTAETEEFGTQCWIDFAETWQWRLYMTLVSVSLFVLPAILIATCYIIIVVTIWSKSKEMHMPAANSRQGSSGPASHKQGSSGQVKAGGNSSCSEALIKRGNKNHWERRIRLVGTSGKSNGRSIEEIETRRASSRGLIPKAKVKTIKMTFVIIFVFILCWSPYIVFDLLQVYDCIPDTKTMSAVATFIQSLAPLNSAANPIIYCLFSTNAGANLCNFFRGKRSNRGDTLQHGRNGGGANGRGGRVKHHILNSHNTAQTTKSTTLHSDSNTAIETQRSNNSNSVKFKTEPTAMDDSARLCYRRSNVGGAVKLVAADLENISASETLEKDADHSTAKIFSDSATVDSANIGEGSRLLITAAL